MESRNVVEERDVVQGSLPVEHALQLRVGGNDVASLLCTPDRLVELAVGWLHAQGLRVESPDAIALTRGERVSVIELADWPAGAMPWRDYVLAGLDAGVLLVRAQATIPDDAWMASDVFEARVREAFEAFRAARGSGGYHHAAFVAADGVHSLVLDLSRHNAVDKVVGEALLAGRTPTHAALVLSGRISADIALKAARLGVPVVASRSLPTAQAVELAQASGLLLVCRVLDHRRITFGRANLRDCST
jgi:FdhD protein